MALLASGFFPSTSRDPVKYSPPSGARSEHFLLITGEVINPVLFESFIVEHPMVHSAIMLGHGRYNTGILIELEDRYSIDTEDAAQVEEMKNKLWPAIDRMNLFAPQHARVQKEMIIFTSPTKPFVYTRLSAVRVNRRKTLAEFNDEINALYDSLARASQIRLTPPKIWSPENSLAYVQGVITAVLGYKLRDDADFFVHGADSMQATRVRIILFHALQSTAKIDTRKLSGNVVYQYRSITALSTFATRTVMTCFRNRTEMSKARCLEMAKMVRFYGHGFPQHGPSISRSRDDVILITGTTGLFGSNLLAQFLQRSRVTRVYALNRRKSGPGGSLVDRHAKLLHAFGLDPALARHPKLTFLEADASRCHLGLPKETYQQLLSSVTHIMHNAWLSTGDNKLPLSTFDPSFRILRNLVDFALSSHLPSPPRFLFTSSTDTIRGMPDSAPKQTSEREGVGGATTPGSLVGACNAAGGAYGESKWVGEQILTAAASSTPLRPIIIQLGPLCGAANGRWRDDAYFPMIVHLGISLKVLPRIDEVVHWLPVHAAAQIIAEMRDSNSIHLHVTHPCPVSSLSLLRLISEELHLPLIPLDQWTTELEEKVHATAFLSSAPSTSASTEPDDPGLTLLRHIRNVREPAGADTLTRILGHDHVGNGNDDVPLVTLRGGVNIPSLGMADVKLWLEHWKKVGLM